MAFDLGGDFLCHLTDPEGVTIHEFGSDYVLGVHTDDLGVERVVRYELRPPGRSHGPPGPGTPTPPTPYGNPYRSRYARSNSSKATM